MSSVTEFHRERRDVRAHHRSDRLAYIVRELPRRLAHFLQSSGLPGQLRDQVTGMTSKKDLLNRIEALA